MIAFLHDKKLSKSWKWHLVPALGFFLYGLTYLFLSDKNNLKFYQELLAGEHLIVNILNLLMVLHALTYMLIAKRQLKQFKMELGSVEFWTLQLKHQWANDFVNYQIVAALLMLGDYAISILVFSKTSVFCDLIIGPIVSLFIYSFIVYRNFQFNVVYEKVTTQEIKYKQPKNKINNNTNPMLAELKTRLDNHMDQTKAFTNPELSIQKLAEELKVSPTLLSQTINQLYAGTFFDYISHMRVEKAKSLLTSTDMQHIRVESIGEMSGFNSRSSFFSVFKKLTGLTPADFKKAANLY